MERRLKIIVFITLIALLLYFLSFQNNNKKSESVVFFDVGQGDAALIFFDNGEKMLVDCGLNKKILTKLGSAMSFFDRKIDYLLVTHPDGDHYGGCPAVFERYDVKNIITNGVEKSSDPFWGAWQKYKNLENANEKIVSGKEVVKIGKSELLFFSPDSNLNIEQSKTGGNNSSIVFMLKNSLGKILFTGDMEEPLEQAIIDKYCKNFEHCKTLEADYLKVGHHGSDSSSGADFLKLVNPKFSIISVGQNNFGHPSLRTMRKLQRVDSKIWRTDKLNDIIIK